MTGEGVGRLFAPGSLCSDGPFPEHYEPMESPVNNGMSKIQNDPAVHLYKDAKDTFAAIDSEFPYVATTYRVTEHEHFVTHARALSGGGDARLLRRAAGGTGRGEGDHQRRQGEGAVEAG